MTKYLFYCLQLRIYISLIVADLDPFDTVVWVPLPAFHNRAAATEGAERIVQTAIDLLEEASTYVTPGMCGTTVNMEVDCISHVACYNSTLVPPDVGVIDWLSDTSAPLESKRRQIKTDLPNLLLDLASAHFNGDTGRGGGRYAIRARA